MPKIKNTSKDVDIAEYAKTLADLKQRIRDAQISAVLSVNKELLKLYWHIGETIYHKKWGTKINEALAEDLQRSFPGISGFSRANIFRMQAFYTAYEKVAQAARQLEELPIFSIPWFHNVVILQRIKNDTERIWYAKKTIENGWSRRLLESAIDSDIYSRDGKALTNFAQALPESQSLLAQETLKDPLIFGFIELPEDHAEKDVEQGLVDNIQKTLLEFGKGFAFVGRQVNIHVGGKDRYIDLLFYNISLHCYCVIELKSREFDPRDAGQISFYISAVDSLIKGPHDNPTIGLLLCREKDKITVEWTLRSSKGPIAVASYLTKVLPKDLKGTLPSVKELERELQKHELLKPLEQRSAKKSKRVKTLKSVIKTKKGV